MMDARKTEIMFSEFRFDHLEGNNHPIASKGFMQQQFESRQASNTQSPGKKETFKQLLEKDAEAGTKPKPIANDLSGIVKPEAQIYRTAHEKHDFHSEDPVFIVHAHSAHSQILPSDTAKQPMQITNQQPYLIDPYPLQ